MSRAKSEERLLSLSAYRRDRGQGEWAGLWLYLPSGVGVRPEVTHAHLRYICSISFLALMERATVRLLRGGALVSALEAGVLRGWGVPDDLGSGKRGLFQQDWGGVCPVPVRDQRFPPSARSVPRPVTAGGPRPRPVSRPLVQQASVSVRKAGSSSW